LGTKVDISHTKKGGRIVIHYYSDEELHAILEQIAGE
jgi:ParB family chromosome partitioning protein